MKHLAPTPGPAFQINSLLGKRITLIPVWSSYATTGNPSLVLMLSSEDEPSVPYTKASVNLLESPGTGNIHIKTDRENEGLLEELVEAGLLERVGEVQYGFTSGAVCKIIDPFYLSLTNNS